MSTVAAPPPGLRRVPVVRSGPRSRFARRFVFPVMKGGSMVPCNNGKEEPANGGLNNNERVPHLRISSDQPDMVPRLEIQSDPSNLRFDRRQLSDEECDSRQRRFFGRFVAREAILDEEYWTAAWLRAESHWEDQPDVRYVDSFKRKFAEQEFNALKKRCTGQHAEKCICIVGVKNDEKNSKRTVLSSIVGTLDVRIRHLLQGETFPGECGKASFTCCIYEANQPKYGYVSNLCVAKYTRRHGIASNMLLLAIDIAKSYGADKVYVHVNKNNMGAQKLYDKIGFKMVDIAAPLPPTVNYLLSLAT
uniref:N-acetyltransferase domain-containing protein n=1 Tax=Ananas comosus var. bracteatus TaxID=296719 RepID=A0A6V7PN93_ANACO|nr:unnamed protein product [Ananas comosus var. bracteatus]